jgi:hypothetical protein
MTSVLGWLAKKRLARCLREGDAPMRKRKSTFIFGLFLMFGLLSSHTAMAQSTIVSVPSTDVVAEKKVYLEFDFTTNYAWERQGSFRSYVPRGVVGVGRNVEGGVNVAYTDGAGVQPIEIQPNFKWRFYKSEGKGVAASLGCILYVPVTRRKGTNTFGMCYSAFSKKLNGNYGPRLTGGAYALVNRHDGEGAKGGAIAGYEQPLSGRVSFVVDWFSGENRFGYVTPGFSFATTSTSALFTGYSIANHGRGNNALFAFYGITF